MSDDEDRSVESDLVSISLLDLAMAGCWFLLGSTSFFQQHGIGMAAISWFLGLGLLGAAWAVRLARIPGVWLHTAFAPSIACLLAVLFLNVRWDRHLEGGLVGYLFVAQAIVLLPMLGWSLYRIHSPTVIEFLEDQVPLRFAGLRKPPFPGFGAASVFAWLILLLGFFGALQWGAGR